MASKAYVCGTCDTKGDELVYVRDLIAAAGVPTVLVDLGTRSDGARADITPATVAAHHPGGAGAVFVDDRGRAVAAMAEAFVRFASARADIGGMIGLGGSGGTALITPAMRALPVGVPKVMVSTVASGNTAPYVGPSDLCMIYSVTDVAGLNRISRQVLGNAAHALAGMLAAAAAGRGRRQAGARAHDVRRDHALRPTGHPGARGGLRLPGLPRHRHRRPVDGEAGRFRADRGRDRRHHDRGLRPADGRRVQRGRRPAGRDRAHGRALRRRLRRPRHGQFRRPGHGAGALPGPQPLRPQPAGHADADHGRGEPADGRVDRSEAQRLSRARCASCCPRAASR